MRYDDDRYLDDEEDNDLWDDELELNSDESQPGYSGRPRQSYASESSYSPYHDDDDFGQDGYHSAYEAETPRQPEPEPDDYYSDPEPEPEPAHPARQKRGGIFARTLGQHDEDDDNDYYDSDAAPAPVRKPKGPKLDPEDPDYWIGEEESPLSGIMPKPRRKWLWKLIGSIAAAAAILGTWIWFMRPYADSAVKYGYIRNMERRGSIIKTFEGTMIPYKELGDPDPLYFQELDFSVASDSVAALMKRMMLGCVPVRVEYELYHTPLPWKGEQRLVVVKADTADTRKILPPEYR